MLDYSFAQITRQEGAIAVSYETELAMPLEAAVCALSAIMQELCALAETEQCVAGHIKAFLKNGNNACRLSATGGPVSRETLTEGQMGTATQVSFTAIVLLMEEEILRTFVENRFWKLEETE